MQGTDVTDVGMDRQRSASGRRWWARRTELGRIGRRVAHPMTAAILVWSVLWSAGAAYAANDAGVTIAIAQAFPGGPPAGWSASGAAVDSGAWVTDAAEGSFPSPTTAAFHRETTEFGAAGTFHMKINFTITVVGLTSATWVITRTGSDAYATMTGQGVCEPTSGPAPFVITCTGLVHM